MTEKKEKLKQTLEFQNQICETAICVCVCVSVCVLCVCV